MMATAFETTISIPKDIADKVSTSNIYENYTQTGRMSSYGVELTLEELELRKTLKASSLDLLTSKIESTFTTWGKQYERHQTKQHQTNQATSVKEMNDAAEKELKQLQSILSHTLSIDDTVNFDTLKRTTEFQLDPKHLANFDSATKYVEFGKNGCPVKFKKLNGEKKPQIEEVIATYGLLARLFRRGKIEKDFQNRLDQWNKQREQVDATNENRERYFESLVNEFESKKQAYDHETQRINSDVESFKSRYLTRDPDAISEYCDLVLSNSDYPDLFPQDWDLEYRHEGGILIVDYQLPAPDEMPKVASYSYVKTRDSINEKPLSEAARKKLFDGVVYQVAIRTIHELFEADSVNALQSVCFNGIVTSRNPATGNMETKVIVSVSSNKDEFLAFDLSNIDPKATFKHLKGVSAASLSGLSPVQPLIVMDKEDRRFIDSKAIAAGLDQGVNLASMDWADFEHLIRELFEKEFAQSGGEVKVTQGSSDGGVDAIAFDPDPIRGGKIVIQAKRYTNTVGVAAVRDLYGTVMNEGATKGILVTTSDYGSDSYQFAKDKPLTLLNGSNLLNMLQQHGHKAKIDIAEAKQFLNENA